MANKKILYLSTHPFENIGAFSGTNRRIFDALSELEDFEVDYYQAKPNSLIRFLIRSIGFVYRNVFHKDYQTGLEERFYPSICRRALRYLSKKHYDAVICWQICFGGVFDKFHGKKIFFADSTYHAMVPYYEWDVSTKNFATVDSSQRKLLKNCNQFWCFSSYFIEDATGYYGIDKSKIISFRFFPTVVGDGKKKENDPGNDIRFLLVGTNYKDKGVPLAMETVKIINEKYGIKARLDVVGLCAQGEDDNKYVQFHGRVSQFKEPKRFVSFFEKADIYLMPSRHECAGIVFSEAASFGVPSVSFKTGGIPDYVKEGESGYLLKEGSSADEFASLIVSRLLKNNQLESISRSSRLYYEKTLSRDIFKEKSLACLIRLFKEK